MNHIGSKAATLVLQVQEFDGLAQFALPLPARLIEPLLGSEPVSEEASATILELVQDLVEGANQACDPLPSHNYEHRGADQFQGVIYQQGHLLDVYLRQSPLGEVVLLRYGNDTHDYITAPVGSSDPLVDNARRMIEFRRL